MTKEKKKGRKKKPIDWKVLDALLSLRASERYVAEYLLKAEGVNQLDIDQRMIAKKIKHIQRRIRERWDVSFVQYREQKQDDWKIELLQIQRKAAQNGKVAMMIWLGKQDLCQSDKMEERIDYTTKGAAIESPVILIPTNGTEAPEDTSY